MKSILALMTILFGISGIWYIAARQALWGMLVLVIAAVYAFGFERSSKSKEHEAAHVLTGGIFAIVAGGFLILEKLFSLLSEPSKFTASDVTFLIICILSIPFMIKARRVFE